MTQLYSLDCWKLYYYWSIFMTPNIFNRFGPSAQALVRTFNIPYARNFAFDSQPVQLVRGLHEEPTPYGSTEELARLELSNHGCENDRGRNLRTEQASRHEGVRSTRLTFEMHVACRRRPEEQPALDKTIVSMPPLTGADSNSIVFTKIVHCYCARFVLQYTFKAKKKTRKY